MNQSEAALVLFSGGQDFDHLPGLGAGAVRPRGDGRLRLRPAPRRRARLPRRRCAQALAALARLGRAARARTTWSISAPRWPASAPPRSPRRREIRMTAEGLPSTFVPGRNLVFLAYAAAVAYRRGLRRIVAGMCETDYSGYPDCRDDTLKAMQLALNLGMDAPLRGRDAADVGGQGGHLGARRGAGRRGAGRADRRAHP